MSARPKIRIFRKTVQMALAVFCAATVVWLGSSAWVTWKLTRRNCPPFPEPPPHVPWGDILGCRLSTPDGEEIGGWSVRGEPRKACVLLLHGNGASRAQMMQVMQWLAEAKHTVLAVSLRTHGDSTGQVNDIGWSARRDVVAAVRFLQNECPGCPVYIVGRSLGAAAAIFAAGELGDDIAGYFLEQPYQDLRSAVQNRLQHYLPPLLDRIAYAGMLLWAPVFLAADPDQISPYNRIEDIPASVPVVLISGSADQHARIEEVELLYERVASHAKLLVVDDARHEPLDQKAPSFYRTALFDLIGI